MYPGDTMYCILWLWLFSRPVGPIPVPPIYLAGGFGPVLPPGWIDYTRSSAVPQNVEGYTRPTSPLGANKPCFASRCSRSRAHSPRARRE